MMAGVSTTTPTGDKPSAIKVGKRRYESKEYVIKESGLQSVQPIVIANWKKLRSVEELLQNRRSREVLHTESEKLKQQAEHVVNTLMVKFGIGEDKIKYLYNLDKETLVEELRKEGEAISKRASPDVFVCFIIARGLDNFFYDIQADDKNSKKVYFKEVMENFNGTNCPGLVLRPKLFFIQTECEPSVKPQPALFSSTDVKKSEEPVTKTIPVEADFLVYSLTSPDFPQHPLQFVDLICEELKDQQDILHATVKINVKVQEATEDDIEKGGSCDYEIQKKIPLCTSQLTKDCIL